MRRGQTLKLTQEVENLKKGSTAKLKRIIAGSSPQLYLIQVTHDEQGKKVDPTKVYAKGEFYVYKQAFEKAWASQKA